MLPAALGGPTPKWHKRSTNYRQHPSRWFGNLVCRKVTVDVIAGKSSEALASDTDLNFVECKLYAVLNTRFLQINGARISEHVTRCNGRGGAPSCPV
jgi:hypothetical protein